MQRELSQGIIWYLVYFKRGCFKIWRWQLSSSVCRCEYNLSLQQKSLPLAIQAQAVERQTWRCHQWAACTLICSCISQFSLKSNWRRRLVGPLQVQRWLNSTSWWFLTAREVSKTSGGLGAQGQCRRREADVELHHLSQPLLVLLVFLFLPPQMVCVVVMFKHIWFAQQNYKVLNCAKWRILPLGTITCLTIFIVKCMLLAYSAPCDLMETGGTACVRQNEKVGVCMIRDTHRHFWEGMNINRCQFWVGEYQ